GTPYGGLDPRVPPDRRAGSGGMASASNHMAPRGAVGVTGSGGGGGDPSGRSLPPRPGSPGPMDGEQGNGGWLPSGLGEVRHPARLGGSDRVRHGRGPDPG